MHNDDDLDDQPYQPDDPVFEQAMARPKRVLTPTVYDHAELGELRVLTWLGQPWFVAADVARAIGILARNATNLVANLDSDEKHTFVISTLGGPQTVLAMSESGVYISAFRSNDAVAYGTRAHTFRKWVTSVVLPTIRKAGKYSFAEEVDAEPVTAPVKSAFSAAQARERRLIATLVMKACPHLSEPVKQALMVTVCESAGLLLPAPVVANSQTYTATQLAEFVGMTVQALSRTETYKLLAQQAGNTVTVQIMDHNSKPREAVRWTEEGRRALEQVDWSEHNLH